MTTRTRPPTKVRETRFREQSYTQLVEHLDNLIELLDSTGTYAPNETELQIATLNTYSAWLQGANTAVMNAATPLSNSRIWNRSTEPIRPNSNRSAASNSHIRESV